MLIRVIGPAGSGKTSRLYNQLEQAFLSGEECVWICPEQQTLQYEREILARLGDGCNLSVEILNFERLPERIAREYGDLSVLYPDKGALCALLSVLTFENKKHLVEYARSAEDADFTSGLLGLFGKLRSERITPDKLDAEVEKGSFSGKRLENKVKDIALLYRAYDAYFNDTRRDMRDALTVLADSLSEKPFFRGKTVFVDGYYTFTGQEYALLAEILKQANNLYCSFTYDGREIFRGNADCAGKLARYAREVKDIPVGEYKRSNSRELRFLEQYLWSTETPLYNGTHGDVEILTAEHAFGEAEAVASKILSLVRSGMRYRDVTVLARGVESYRGILDTVLAGNGIPYFFSEKEELSSRPLAAFLLAALELVVTDFSLPSVRKYLKNGYCLLSPEESDLLLRYGESWTMRGKDWYGDISWTRNPDGYSDRPMDEEQTANLAAVNAAREKVLPCFLALRQDLKGKDLTGKDFLAGLYNHLSAVGAEETFARKVEEKVLHGDPQEAEREAGLWNLLMNVFDRLNDLCGEKPMTAKRMLALLKLTFTQYTLGALPVTEDAVTVGEAALLRPENPRAVIIMGCNDGVFPATIGKDPLFDDDEAGILETADIPVVEGKTSRMNAERFYFYSAVCSPSEKLIFTYPLGTWSGEELRPSAALERVKMLLPHVKPLLYTGRGEQGLFSSQNAASLFFTLPEGSQREELRALLAEQGITLPESRMPMTLREAKIPYKGNSLRLSPSKIELYRGCPFSYFGNAVMKLKEKKTNRFANQESGSFLHAVLEQFLRAHTADGKFIPPESEEALRREADGYIDDYLTRVTGGADDKSKRFLHTCENLKKTLYLLLSNLTGELSGSDFIPAGFEVTMGMQDSKLPAVEYITPEGKRVYLIGSIDRVDTYQKDGVTYVRVVDYKSYAKELHMESVEDYGLDQQMLLYLFAYCRLNAKDGEIFMPAGVLYNPVRLTFARETGGETEEDLQTDREKKLCRTGILLEDPEIIRAMDKSGSGKYLSVKFDKDGALKKSKYLLPAEEFERLNRLVETQLIRLGEDIFAGEMDIRPLKLGNYHDACQYCKLQSACRYNGEGGTEYES